jgi:hypothetical protein
VRPPNPASALLSSQAALETPTLTHDSGMGSVVYSVG